MKFLFCPQCGIRRFYLKNKSGDVVVVQVSQDYQIIPIKENETIDDFDNTILYCLGCSWKGTIHDLIKIPH